MPFYKKKQTTFKIGKLDIFVVIVVFCVFIWAFFFDSFKPMRDENDTIMVDPTTNQPLIKINFQVFIGSLILVYEMMVLIILDGKKRGRYLPWGLYYGLLKYTIKMKLKEGKDQYKEWKDLRTK